MSLQFLHELDGARRITLSRLDHMVEPSDSDNTRRLQGVSESV